jgi:hypothetical protein
LFEIVDVFSRRSRPTRSLFGFLGHAPRHDVLSSSGKQSECPTGDEGCQTYMAE